MPRPSGRGRSERCDAKRDARGSPCCSRRRPVFRYQDPSADCTGEPRLGFSRPIGQLRGSAAFDIVQRDTTSELPIPRVRGDQLPAGLRAGAGEARQFCSKSSTLTRVWFRTEPDQDASVTNQDGCREKYDFRSQAPEDKRRGSGGSPASSGSNQAREGRLVDALAARGDEGRDTLR